MTHFLQSLKTLVPFRIIDNGNQPYPSPATLILIELESLKAPRNFNYGSQIGIEIGIDQKTEFIAKIGSFDTDPDSDPDPGSIKIRIAETADYRLT